MTTRRSPPSPKGPSSAREPAQFLPASPRTNALTPAQALALQRSAGNRATGRALARWAAHPDKDKKGALVPDAVAAEYLRYNPPKNQ